MNKKTLQKSDTALLAISGILLVTGLFILASASVGLAQREAGNAFYYVTRQITLGVSVGILGALVVQVVPMEFFKRLAPTIFLGTIILLFAVFLPGVGVGTGGAVRWIHAGPITIQPSEIAKITVPLYLAAWLAPQNIFGKRRRHAHKSSQDEIVTSKDRRFFPFFIIVGAVGLPLILQPDISTLGVIALTGAAMYFLSGAPLRDIGALAIAGAGAFVVLVRVAPYRVNRILAFLHPEIDPLGVGYQINQALLAVGSGGIFGRGLGFSREKLFFLPEPMGDSIFAVFAEESGFVGATVLIALFVIFLWRGFSIIRRLQEPFLRLFAAGLVSWIVIQALLNIAGNLGLAPLVGITLPFVSYGSASIATTLISVGFLYKLSRYVKANGQD